MTARKLRSMDDWYWWLQVGSVFTALVASAFLVGTTLVGRAINNRDSARLVMLETDLEAAKADAARSLSEVAVATERTAALNQVAESLRLDVAAANERLARQREQAAKAERELLEIQERLAWRTLSPQQFDIASKALASFSGTAVEITLLGEMEAQRFGSQIQAGWNVTTNLMGVSSPPPYGVICRHPANDAASAAFVNAMRKAGVTVSEQILGQKLTVLVGLRRPI